MKFILTLLIALIIILNASGQNKLTVNDKVPDITLKNFYNIKQRPLKFSNIHSKLILLDFWDVWCGSCIAAMPKLDSLKKIFGSKIEIILVTKNNVRAVQNLFTRHPEIKVPNLRMIINDQYLSRTFPHQSVPHHVWLDSNRVVKYITNGEYFTKDNINAFLKGTNLKLHLKNEASIFDYDMPLFEEGNGRLNKHLLSYSYFMNQVTETESGFAARLVDSVKQRAGLKFLNNQLIDLYSAAYGDTQNGGDFQFRNRIILNVKDTSLFVKPSSLDYHEWASKGVYSYELSLPLHEYAELFSVMRSDLERTFPYRAYINTRMVKCLSLVRTSSSDYITSKASKTTSVRTDSVEVLKNYSYKMFYSSLYNTYGQHNLPLIDATNFDLNTKIDITLPIPLSDLSKLKIQLQKYGLDIVEVDKEIRMLVIDDN